MMRSFLCGSFVAASLALWGCGRFYPYKNLPSYAGSLPPNYRPDDARKTYRALVDGRFLFKSFHLSGNLLIKRTPDSAVHAVFQNEMGFSFFHFAWFPKPYFYGEPFYPCGRPDSFAVVSIIPQLKKPAVIKLLRKDFSMLLLRGCRMRSERTSATGKTRVSQVQMDAVSGLVYYLGDAHDRLYQIEEWGKRKKVTDISFAPIPYPAPLPDSALIRHHTVNLTIQLNPAHADPADE